MLTTSLFGNLLAFAASAMLGLATVATPNSAGTDVGCCCGPNCTCEACGCADGTCVDCNCPECGCENCNCGSDCCDKTAA